jgi:hypothetical protein
VLSSTHQRTWPLDFTSRHDHGDGHASVMIEKFARSRGRVSSEFLDLNHTSKIMSPVSLLIPKFARTPASMCGELRNRDTRTRSFPWSQGGATRHRARPSANRPRTSSIKAHLAGLAGASTMHGSDFDTIPARQSKGNALSVAGLETMAQILGAMRRQGQLSLLHRIMPGPSVCAAQAPDLNGAARREHIGGAGS